MVPRGLQGSVAFRASALTRASTSVAAVYGHAMGDEESSRSVLGRPAPKKISPLLPLD
jgi:hypothetical protein